MNQLEHLSNQDVKTDGEQHDEEYIVLNRAGIQKQLKQIADVLQSADSLDEAIPEVDSAMGELNGILCADFDKPITVNRHGDQLEFTVDTDQAEDVGKNYR
jgi:hypothetical protein